MDLTNKSVLAVTVVTAFFLVVITALITSKVLTWQWSDKLSAQASAYEKQLAEINRVSNEELVKQQAKRADLEERLAAITTKNFKELSDAQQANSKLVNDLASTRKRLSIAVSSCSSTSRGGVSKATKDGSVDHEKTRAYLDPRDAANIFNIVRRGDEAIRQLNACQDYFLELNK